MQYLSLSQRDAFHVAIAPLLSAIAAFYVDGYYHNVTKAGVLGLADQFKRGVTLMPLGVEHKASQSFPESDAVGWLGNSAEGLKAFPGSDVVWRGNVREPVLQNLPPKERTGRRVCPEPMTGAGTRDAELRAFASAFAPTRRPTRCTLPSSKRDAFYAAIAPALASIGATVDHPIRHYHGVSEEGLMRAAWAFRNGEKVELKETDKQEGAMVREWEAVWWKDTPNASTSSGSWTTLGFDHAAAGPSPNPPFIPISTLSDVMLAHPAARARRVRLSESGGVVIAQHVSDWLNELSWSKGYAIGTVAGEVELLNQQLKELADKAGWADA